MGTWRACPASCLDHATRLSRVVKRCHFPTPYAGNPKRLQGISGRHPSSRDSLVPSHPCTQQTILGFRTHRAYPIGLLLHATPPGHPTHASIASLLFHRDGYIFLSASILSRLLILSIASFTILLLLCFCALVVAADIVGRPHSHSSRDQTLHPSPHVFGVLPRRTQTCHSHT